MFTTYEEMKLIILRQFQSTQEGPMHEKWLALKEEGSLSKYRWRFIEFSTPLVNISKEIAMGTFVNELKVEIKIELKILGPNKLGRTTNWP